jgi:hypothetical protein
MRCGVRRLKAEAEGGLGGRDMGDLPQPITTLIQ